MKKIYYEKIGKKYVPVREYDSDFSYGLCKGDHLISVYPGGQSYKHNIDPAFAPLIAAGRYAEDAMAKAIYNASSLRPSKNPVTQEQHDAWTNLVQAFGDDIYILGSQPAQDIAREAVTILQNNAHLLLSNAAVKNAYEEFMLICKLTK